MLDIDGPRLGRKPGVRRPYARAIHLQAGRPRGPQGRFTSTPRAGVPLPAGEGISEDGSRPYRRAEFRARPSSVRGSERLSRPGSGRSPPRRVRGRGVPPSLRRLGGLQGPIEGLALPLGAGRVRTGGPARPAWWRGASRRAGRRRPGIPAGRGTATGPGSAAAHGPTRWGPRQHDVAPLLLEEENPLLEDLGPGDVQERHARHVEDHASVAVQPVQDLAQVDSPRRRTAAPPPRITITSWAAARRCRRPDLQGLLGQRGGACSTLSLRHLVDEVEERWRPCPTCTPTIRSVTHDRPGRDQEDDRLGPAAAPELRRT